MKNYYEILGVAITATQDEIKKIYRKLAMQFHPDKNPGDKAAEEQFKRTTEAYETLSNNEKRAAYDMSLEEEKAYATYQNRGFQKPINPYTLNVNWGAVAATVIIFICGVAIFSNLTTKNRNFTT